MQCVNRRYRFLEKYVQRLPSHLGQQAGLVGNGATVVVNVLIQGFKHSVKQKLQTKQKAICAY